jgi:hypothetical protein
MRRVSYAAYGEDLPTRALDRRSDEPFLPDFARRAGTALALTLIWFLWIVALAWAAERF